MLRAALYPEAVTVTSLMVSPYWVGVAAAPHKRQRFYAEAARRLDLPDYHPDSAYDPLAQWVIHNADFDLQSLMDEHAHATPTRSRDRRATTNASFGPNTSHQGNATAPPGPLRPQAPSPVGDGELAAGDAGRRPVQRRSRRPAVSPWSGKVTPANSTLAHALDTHPDSEAAADRSGTRASHDRASSRATPANTRRFYGSDLADFEGYCLEHQLPVRLPIPPAVIAAYLSACAQLRPSPNVRHADTAPLRHPQGPRPQRLRRA